jgi:hypothetical protein
MIRMPNQTEWDTSALSVVRRAYLDANFSYEDIASRVVREAKIINSKIEPYRRPPPGATKDVVSARQVIFVIRVDRETCDLLYSARDGLRARYWRSPDHGIAATTRLIRLLLLKLLLSAEESPAICKPGTLPMSLGDIEASLKAPSAKIWPRENDDNGNDLLLDDKLFVPRWADNDRHGDWRLGASGDQLDIKGALLQADRTEQVPPDKTGRANQIFLRGFS